MLKFLIFIVFIVPLCLYKNFWWLIQSLIFLIFFIFMFLFSYFYIWGNVSYLFGCDYISYGLILLRIWICILMIMARESIYYLNYFYSFFLIIILLLLLMLYCAFGRIRLFSYYLFFEGRLIPTLFLILGWGYQPERLQAGIYLLFYTLLASLPIMVGIFYIYNINGILGFSLLYHFGIYNNLFYLGIIIAYSSHSC